MGRVLRLQTRSLWQKYKPRRAWSFGLAIVARGGVTGADGLAVEALSVSTIEVESRKANLWPETGKRIGSARRDAGPSTRIVGAKRGREPCQDRPEGRRSRGQAP